MDPSGAGGVLQVEFDSYSLPIVGTYPTLAQLVEKANLDEIGDIEIPSYAESKLNEIASANPLVE